MRAKDRQEVMDKITSLIAKDSFTIPELCKKAGISKATYHEWYNEFADFSDAIKRAKEVRLEMFGKEAEKSLLKKLKGYDYEEVRTSYIGGEDGTPLLKERVVVKKHIAPDTTALIFTLCNAKPDIWKQKQSVDMNVESTGITVQVTSNEVKDNLDALSKHLSK